MVCAQVAFAVEFGGRSMSVSKMSLLGRRHRKGRAERVPGRPSADQQGRAWNLAVRSCSEVVNIVGLIYIYIHSQYI